MRTILLALLISTTGCSTLNLFASQDAHCREQKAELVPWFRKAAQSEARKSPPSGWATQPYSRENWDKYWNARIYHVWTISQTDCNSTYQGPYGPEIVRSIIQYRRELALPEINLEARNQDKGL